MKQREIAELRRRWKPEGGAVSRIYGCFVNASREIISDLNESLGTMPLEEAEKFLDFLKKVLSGTPGKNLMDITFSTEQVADGVEHSLLMALNDCQLQDAEARQTFYQNVINCLNMGDSNYLLLMASDTYDVPLRGKNHELPELSDSNDVFQYFLCCICPVKEGKPTLGYFPGDNEFHCSTGQIVAAPELGFLFPAFDNRRSNIYNALFYSRKPDEIHQEFIDAIFQVEPLMSAPEQKEAFTSALYDGLNDTCSLEVMQAIHEQLSDQITRHKESRSREPLEMTSDEIGAILQDCGVPSEQVEQFQSRCDEAFGENALLNPENIIDPGRFALKTARAEIIMDPADSYLLETRMIDGRNYILIPIEKDNITVNGLPVQLSPTPVPSAPVSAPVSDSTSAPVSASAPAVSSAPTPVSTPASMSVPVPDTISVSPTTDNSPPENINGQDT